MASLNGKDLRPLPLGERKAKLAKLLAGSTAGIVFCDLRWDQVEFNAAVLHVQRVKNGTPSTHPGPRRALPSWSSSRVFTIRTGATLRSGICSSPAAPSHPAGIRASRCRPRQALDGFLLVHCR
jgi:hypothetical protein